MAPLVEMMDPGMVESTLPQLPSEFAEEKLEWEGRPFRIGKYKYMWKPMNDMSRHVHLVWARQCGKSLLEMIRTLSVASLRPRTSFTIISSAQDNVSILEGQKLAPLMKSPAWRREFFGGGGRWGITYKQLTNDSDIILRSAFTGGARIRGISGGGIVIDELQDVDRKVVEEAESVMTRSELKMLLTGGTQSTLESAVNYYYEISNQQEWLIKCNHCSRWSEPLDRRNIGKTSLICAYCGGWMNAEHDQAQWIACGIDDARVSGYHFPLLALPDHPWDDILYKLEKFTPDMFDVDVLAIPNDSSQKPIGLADLRRCCNEQRLTWYEPEETRGYRVVAGIDWGWDRGSTTQLCILQEVGPNKLKVVFAKSFTGAEADPKRMRGLIAQYIHRYNAQTVCADEGGQFEQNPEMQRLLGPKFSGVQLNHQLKETMQWNVKNGNWTASKPKTLRDTFFALKRGVFELPAWQLYSPFGKEILVEMVEYKGDSQLPHYYCPDGMADDALHALNFAYIAYRLLTGDFKAPPRPGYKPQIVMG